MGYPLDILKFSEIDAYRVRMESDTIDGYASHREKGPDRNSCRTLATALANRRDQKLLRDATLRLGRRPGRVTSQRSADAWKILASPSLPGLRNFRGSHLARTSLHSRLMLAIEPFRPVWHVGDRAGAMTTPSA
jgi:hypothetical protein